MAFSVSYYIRSRPDIKNAYVQIYDDEDLLSSFDTFFTYRQYHLAPKGKDKEDWTQKPAGIHVDQNPRDKPGFHCLQGMVNLQEVNQQIGGLAVVPKTHTNTQEYFCKKYADKIPTGADWLLLDDDDKYQGQQRVVFAEPGSLLLWDSRLIHGGVAGPGYTKETCPLGLDEFYRLSMTTCWMPKSMATEETLVRRRLAFLTGECHTHWPAEVNFSEKFYKYPNQDLFAHDYKIVDETPAITGMIGMSQEEFEAVKHKKKYREMIKELPISKTVKL